MTKWQRRTIEIGIIAAINPVRMAINAGNDTQAPDALMACLNEAAQNLKDALQLAANIKIDETG